MDEQALGLTLNRYGLRIEANLNPQSFGCLHQHRHEVGVKRLERPAAAVQHPDLGAGAGGDVRELERDVAASDEEDATRQALELKELRAAGQEFLTGDSLGGAARASRDDHVATDQRLALHL